MYGCRRISFRRIDIPIIAVIWQYTGISADEMADIFTTRSERGMTTTVNDIEHIESQSMAGTSVIKVFFHPGAKIESAVAQISANSQLLQGYLPDGARAPNVIRYNAATVPILQLGLSSDTLPEQEIADLGNNFIRNQLALIRGASVPSSYGGKNRTIMVDINPQALYARGLSATDVSAAVNAQNVIMPAGSAKMGTREYRVEMNNSPAFLEQFNNIPLKTVQGSTIFLRDVAQVRDGFTVQTNVVRRDGKRGALLSIMKSGDASTIDVVNQVRRELPRILTTLPSSLKVAPLFDQSVFVKEAVSGVVREALIAAGLTGLMILIFLGSWRSTLIVCISIPVVDSGFAVHFVGHGRNREHHDAGRHGPGGRHPGGRRDGGNREHPSQPGHEQAHRPGDSGRRPADRRSRVCFHALHLHCICAGRLPHRNREVPVHSARHRRGSGDDGVLSSFAHACPDADSLPAARRNPHVSGRGRTCGRATTPASLWHIHHQFNNLFKRFQNAYGGVLESALHHRTLVILCFAGVVLGCAAIYPYLGTDFFPTVDAGQIKLHVRAASGSRVEETEQKVAQVEAVIRQEIPSGELNELLDDIGLPTAGTNIAFGDPSTLGTADAEILISLEARSQASHSGLHSRTAQAAESRIPRPDSVLPTGRHRGPNPQLRIARAH